MDCGINTSWLNEFYMVNDELWESLTTEKQHDGMLCVGCIERRLGRELGREDFHSYWRSILVPPQYKLSARLRARMETPVRQFVRRRPLSDVRKDDQ